MSKSNYKKHQEKLLGMPLGTSERKLRKAIIHALASQLGKNICIECGQPICSPEDLAVVHLVDWEEDPSQYFNLDQIALSHVSCRRRNHGRKQDSKMDYVQADIEDLKGNPLESHMHEGSLYVAGEMGQEYQVVLKNLTHKKVLAVVTVDGKNVVTGEPGDWNDKGYVLSPYQRMEVKGWRTSLENVVTFKVGRKEDSYASVQGDSENHGVIGIAVFEPREARGYGVNPWPLVIGGPKGDGYHKPLGYTPYIEHFWVSNMGSGPDYGAFGVHTSNIECSNMTLGTSTDVNHCSSVGTQWGKEMRNVAVEGSFEKKSKTPSQILSFFYDTKESLISRGIWKSSPKRPNPFPGNHRFCSPPK